MATQNYSTLSINEKINCKTWFLCFNPMREVLGQDIDPVERSMPYITYPPEAKITSNFKLIRNL